MHPDQATLKAMMEQAGFDRVEVHNLTAGVVALHLGYVLLTPAHLRQFSPLLENDREDRSA